MDFNIEENYKNSKTNPCYDCGSTIAGHHTALCDMAGKDDKMDLPARPNSQHWTGDMPE